MGTATVTRHLHHSVSTRGPRLDGIREGDAVVAENGVLGRVDRLVRSDGHLPTYLVVRAGRTLWRRYPVVSVSLVTDVDSGRRLVKLRGRRETIGQLPETLPFVL